MIWKETFEHALMNKPDLDLDVINQLVWKPCLDSCEKLLVSLSDLSISLVEIDKVFSFKHKENLETQLHSLLRGVQECTEDLATLDMNSIETAIRKIRQYWNLCRYCQGASVLLKIRDSLGLQCGDFSVVEELSKEV